MVPYHNVANAFGFEKYKFGCYEKYFRILKSENYYFFLKKFKFNIPKFIFSGKKKTSKHNHELHNPYNPKKNYGLYNPQAT